MGSELGQRYHALWNELVQLKLEWSEFENLYAHSEERVALLNQVAPYFFGQFLDMTWRDVLLRIARIVDRPATFKKENLTIQGLERLIPDQVLAQEVTALIADAVTACTFVKDWRDRRLAHNDLALKLQRAAEPLPPARRMDVDRALEAIAAVLNRIHTAYLHSPAVFGPTLLSGGTEALVAYLERAVQAQDQQRERWRQRLQGE